MNIFDIFTIAAFLMRAHALPAPSSVQSDLTLHTPSSITWAACPSEVLGASLLQCASYSVPVDWNEPHGEHFDLGLVKLPGTPSNSTFQKVGTLFVNPGGPGGPASQFVAALALGSIKSEYLGSFDIVGLDPRGVGLSHQVQCDPAIYAERVSLFPQTGEEFAKLKDKNRRFGESCLNRTGGVFEHLDTISVGKDHEAVRIALGDEPINFLGLSYGSQLGAQYADLFPNNIRTLATVNDKDILFNSHQYLTFKQNLGLGSSWDILASALNNSSKGDASALSTKLADPTAYSFLPIGCLDWTRKASSTLPEILAQQIMAKEYAPLTQGGSQMWQLQHACLGWPAKIQNPPKKLNVKTNATILLTQSTSDPSTGFSWALGILEEFQNKVLVMRKGDGHTSLPLGGKTAETILRYLITSKAPEPGLVLDS
ncbi:hypothetical protein E8E12_000768 [Didymella heteroderae]|uniref:AB hydrolase-1 domain-containing protein n=1 Tax=Didymella heteroderae TaxID=1769908 RepID=A0A9P5C2T3_9PLEO|nr:hypothetical protein E8E12_000768 [Didymella heteroderae]